MAQIVGQVDSKQGKRHRLKIQQFTQYTTYKGMQWGKVLVHVDSERGKHNRLKIKRSTQYATCRGQQMAQIVGQVDSKQGKHHRRCSIACFSQDLPVLLGALKHEMMRTAPHLHLM